MKKLSLAVLLLVTTLSPVAFAKKMVEPAVGYIKEAAAAEGELVIQAKVNKIDSKARTVVLQSGDIEVEIPVNKAIDLKKIAVGDTVNSNIEVATMLSLQVGDGRTDQIVSKHSNKSGTQKIVTIDNTYNVTGKQKGQKVQLQDVNNNASWVTVKKKDIFDKVKVGDQVRVILVVRRVLSLDKV